MCPANTPGLRRLPLCRAPLCVSLSYCEGRLSGVDVPIGGQQGGQGPEGPGRRAASCPCLCGRTRAKANSYSSTLSAWWGGMRIWELCPRHLGLLLGASGEDTAARPLLAGAQGMARRLGGASVALRASPPPTCRPPAPPPRSHSRKLLSDPLSQIIVIIF